MGIKVSAKTNLKASLKLYNHINTFLFEQEFDELRSYSPAQISKIKEAAKTIKSVISNG